MLSAQPDMDQSTEPLKSYAHTSQKATPQHGMESEKNASTLTNVQPTTEDALTSVSTPSEDMNVPAQMVTHVPNKRTTSTSSSIHPHPLVLITSI